MSYSDWLMGAVQRSTGNATGGNSDAALMVSQIRAQAFEAGRAAFAADLAEQGKVVVHRAGLIQVLDKYYATVEDVNLIGLDPDDLLGEKSDV